jgi:hypothetical protein
VEKNIANEKNWAMQAGDMSNQRYSRLKQVNKGNVDKLRVAWTFSTGVLRGHEGSPLVVDGIMYLHSPFPNKVFAVELDTQKILWKYEPKQDSAVIAQMCCDTVNRNVAYAENKVILQQADSMQQHQGPFYEMLHKCACALDEVAAQLSFAEYVELSTIANAMTIAGERGNGMRDNESLKAPFARFKQLNKQAEKACFITPPASLR